MDNPNPPGTPLDLLREAIAHDRAGERATALLLLENLPECEEEVSRAVALFFLHCHYEQGNTPLLLKGFRRYLNDNPQEKDLAERWFLAAIEALEVESAHEAIAYLPGENREAALGQVADLKNRLGTPFAPARQRRWIHSVLKKPFPLAKKEGDRLEQLHEEFPADEEARFALACHQATRMDLPCSEGDRRALVLFRSLWRGKQDGGRIARWVAVLTFRVRDYTTCLEALADCEKAFPKEAIYPRLRAASLEYLGKSAEALDLYRQSVEMDPESLGAWGNLLALSEKLGLVELKAEQVRRLLKQDPKNPLLPLFWEGPGTIGARREKAPAPAKEKGDGSLWKRLLSGSGAHLPTAGEVAQELSARLVCDKRTRKDPCDLCGSDSFSGVAPSDRGRRPVMRCDRCGLQQVWPRMEGEEPRTESGNNHFFKSWKIIDTNVRELLEQAPHHPRILDLLRESRVEGKGETAALVRGTDSDQWSSDLTALGWNTVQGEETMAPVSMILLEEVLPVALSPMKELKAARERLAPGGWVVVKCLGVENFPQRIVGEDWYLPLPHRYFFTRHTLSEMVAKAGFEVVADRTLVGAGRESDGSLWWEEGFGPAFREKVETKNLGDVLVLVARLPEKRNL